MSNESGSAVTGDSIVTPVDRRRWIRAVLLWGLPLLAVLGGLYWYGSGGRYASTDDAYVKQERVDVTPQIGGDVREVRVVENAKVHAGEVLLVLDDALLKVAVLRAEAALAAARLEVESLRAGYREKTGEVAVARRASEYSLRELDRQDELARRKLVPQSTLDAARRSRDIAVGSIDVLELQLGQIRTRLGGDPGIPVDRHPTVLAAAAELEKARVDLSRTVIYAPRNGIVSHLPQVGDRVEAGRPALAIMAEGGLWLEANFKETDLEWVRPGQPVSFEVDTYPAERWSGRVESIAQATGAEFSVLPPQNASGNWVKVVQRVPVRVAIDTRPGQPPLRSGMSVTVEIDTGAHRRFDRWFKRRG